MILGVSALAVPVFAGDGFQAVAPEPNTVILVAGLGLGLAAIHKLRNKSK